jgi:hypothetical protein
MTDPFLSGCRPQPDAEYLLGLGLGRANGPAALAVLSRTRDRPARYTVAHLQRWAGGTPYPAMAEEVRAVAAGCPGPVARLLIDARLGEAVTRTFLRNRGPAPASPVVVTNESGQEPRWDEQGRVHVCGDDLASAVLATLQEDRLEFGPVEGRDALLRGLSAFSGNAGLLGRVAALLFGDGPGDELVMGTAAAVWFGECQLRRPWLA